MVNAGFQSALSNNIVAEHPELWFGEQFYIMNDLICCELRVMLIATGTSVKCYSPKMFLPSKHPLKISFSRIMRMLQRLLETSVQSNICNFFLGLLIRLICHLLNTCEICLVGVSLGICVLQFQKTNFV